MKGLVITVNSQYLTVEYYLKPISRSTFSFYLSLLISQSKFSGPRKFTLRYQRFKIKRAEL